MSTSIIKSARLGESRVKLGAEPGSEAGSGPRHAATSPAGEMAALEERLRAEYAGELEARLAELKAASQEEGFQKGYREGLAAGHPDGVAAGKESVRAQLTRLDGVLMQAEQSLSEFWRSTHQAVEDFTMEAICRLLGEHALDPAVIGGMVRQVMGQLHDGDVLAVRLHPAEHAKLLEAIEGADETLRLRLGRLALRLTADPALDKGGCVIQTSRGEYCGGLEVQLRRLRSALERQRRQSGSTGAMGEVACA